MRVYDLKLAWQGMRRFPRSTVLVVVTVALGISACMTTLTLLHVLSADPLPGRSQYLYHAWVNTVLNAPRSVEASMKLNNIQEGENYYRVKSADAHALLAAHKASAQTVVADVVANEVAENGEHADNGQVILATTSALMPMFGLKLRYGRDWTPAEDAAHRPVAVIDTRLARKLFGTDNAVGKAVRLDKTLFRVVGVIEPFSINPHFYALNMGAFSTDDGENMLVPYTAALDAGLNPQSSDACDAGYKAPRHTNPTDPKACASLGVWAELDTPAQVSHYRAFLHHYVAAQAGALADFHKQPESRLISVPRWLVMNHAVPDSVALNVWLAVAFLVLCLLNVMGILSARFFRRTHEIGIRRALGAPRRAIFAQHILEAGLVCMAGGVMALPLTFLGLWILRQQGTEFTELAHLDGAMFGVLFMVAAVAGALVGAIPAWRASRIEPGLQVKAE